MRSRLLRQALFAALGVCGGPAAAQVCEPAWSSAFANHITDGELFSLAMFDAGGGPELHASGYFRYAGGVRASLIARFDGERWHPLGQGLEGPYAVARVIVVHDDGGGPALYAGGSFESAGGAPAAYVARWDGAAWGPVGEGLGGEVQAMISHNDGSPGLFAGVELGAGHEIMRWDGAAWTSIGVLGGSAPFSAAFASHDDGSGHALYVAGRFNSIGGVSAVNVARWNGGWAPVGDGIASTSVGGAYALTVHDDGTGPALYIGGRFGAGFPAPTQQIGIWNGTEWRMFDSLGSNAVSRLGSFDDGSGPVLFAHGTVQAGRLALWDGTAWSFVDVYGYITSFLADETAGSPRLIVAGGFEPTHLRWMV